MALIAKCNNSQCGAALRIPDSVTEVRIRCPQCGEVFGVSEAPAFVIFDLESWPWRTRSKSCGDDLSWTVIAEGFPGELHFSPPFSLGKDRSGNQDH